MAPVNNVTMSGMIVRCLNSKAPAAFSSCFAHVQGSLSLETFACASVASVMASVSKLNSFRPQNPDKEMNRQELLNQPMRVQIAGLPCTVIISLSE